MSSQSKKKADYALIVTFLMILALPFLIVYWIHKFVDSKISKEFSEVNQGRIVIGLMNYLCAIMASYILFNHKTVDQADFIAFCVISIFSISYTFYLIKMYQDRLISAGKFCNHIYELIRTDGHQITPEYIQDLYRSYKIKEDDRVLVINEIFESVIGYCIEDFEICEKEKIVMDRLSQAFSIDNRYNDLLGNMDLLLSGIRANYRGNTLLYHEPEGFSLYKGERVVFAENGVVLFEEVYNRYHIGGSISLGVLDPSGLFSPRGYVSRYINERKLVEGAVGCLVFTERRIVFIGAENAKEIRYNKLAQVQTDENFLIIKGMSKKSTAIYKLSSHYLAQVVKILAVSLIKGDGSVLEQASSNEVEQHMVIDDPKNKDVLLLLEKYSIQFRDSIISFIEEYDFDAFIEERKGFDIVTIRSEAKIVGHFILNETMLKLVYYINGKPKATNPFSKKSDWEKYKSSFLNLLNKESTKETERPQVSH